MKRLESKASVRRGSGAAVFAALGDDTRLWLVARLCGDGPLSITQLAAGAQVTRQAVTKHLRVMEHAGLTRSERRGRETVWRLERRRLKRAQRHLALISKQWDQALARLRNLVEN